MLDVFLQQSKVIGNNTDHNWKQALFAFPHLIWWEYLVHSGVCVVLVLFAGMCSGLTLGLLSIDQMSLNIMLGAGTDTEKKYARKLEPILRRHHLLLVTLLLWNALAMEALPLFLDRMVPEFLAIILSVTFVLIFGEVLPQAVISRYGVAIGGHLAWFVKLLMIIALPVAWPASKLLDCMLGHSESYYKRAELKELVNIHALENEGGILSNDEIAVIRGALELKEKKVESISTPIEKVYMLAIERSLDMTTMEEILKSGHSRIPVFRNGNRQDVVGLLLVKNLILLNPEKATPISHLLLREIPSISHDMQLYDVLNMFQAHKTHMALVRRKFSDKGKEVLGDLNSEEQIVAIVTLEDIFEELIQEEIMDETDVHKQIQVADMFRRITTTIKRKPGLLTSMPLDDRHYTINVGGNHQSGSKNSARSNRSPHMRTQSMVVDESTRLLGTNTSIPRTISMFDAQTMA